MFPPDCDVRTRGRAWKGVRTSRSAGGPADRGQDVLGQRRQQPGVVVDAQLVGDRQQQGVGLTYGDVLGQLLGQRVRLTDVRLAEARDAAVEVAQLVLTRA